MKHPNLTWPQRWAYAKAWWYCAMWRLHCQHWSDTAWDLIPTVSCKMLCQDPCPSTCLVTDACTKCPLEVVCITATDEDHDIKKVFWERRR